MDVLVTV